MTDPPVQIQAALTSVPSTLSWFGEVAVVAHAFNRSGVMKAIEERVRFARARMGKYETTDFVALFGRSDLPDPAALSRYLAALDQPCPRVAQRGHSK